MSTIIRRRPILSAFAIVTLFLIYCVSLLRNPAVTFPSSSPEPWPDTWLNGAPPLPTEAIEQPFPAADIPSLDTPPGGITPLNALPSGSFDFLHDIPHPLPTTDLSTLTHYRPHNLNLTHPSPTFATYYSTRSPTLHDPYFISTLHLIYLTLYHPPTRSPTHPITIFTTPHTPATHTAIFLGAGAHVITLPLLPFSPPNPTYPHWRDLFTKLHMWSQTQFSQIAYLDSDTALLRPLDPIFALFPPQRCLPRNLPPSDPDRPRLDALCNYTFAGAQIMATTEINAGVLLLAPNEAMHARLVRNMNHTEAFDSSVVEQGFFNWMFNASGAFPPNYLPREYNGFFPQEGERESLRVVHEKLWVGDVWGEGIFESTHREMVEWFDGVEFLMGREGDGLVVRS